MVISRAAFLTVGGDSSESSSAVVVMVVVVSMAVAVTAVAAVAAAAAVVAETDSSPIGGTILSVFLPLPATRADALAPVVVVVAAASVAAAAAAVEVASEVVADSSEIGGRVLSFFFPLSTSRADALVGVLSIVPRFFPPIIIWRRYYRMDMMDMEVCRFFSVYSTVLSDALEGVM